MYLIDEYDHTGPAEFASSAGTATSISISIRSTLFKTIFFAAFSSGASNMTTVSYFPSVR